MDNVIITALISGDCGSGGSSTRPPTALLFVRSSEFVKVKYKNKVIKEQYYGAN